MSKEATIQCIVDSRDFLEAEFFEGGVDGGTIGIDLYIDNDDNVGAILLKKEGAKKLRDFLDAHLDDLQEGDND
jgi:hypothetical protein